MKAKAAVAMRGVQRLVQQAGPYVLIELVLPGGTLIALGLYLYRKGHLRGVADALAAGFGILRTAGRVFDQMAFAWQPPVNAGTDASERTLPGWGAQRLLPGG